jgi:hypothetical protein
LEKKALGDELRLKYEETKAEVLRIARRTVRGGAA